MIRDTTIDTSDRIDAIDSLLEIADESEHQVSALVAKLDTADRYERLITAAKLARGCDKRAMKVLEELTVETEDDGLIAIAVLMLVRNGRSSEGTVDRLVEMAPRQDHRYQLETGYLLAKIGHPATEKFSYEELMDKNGVPVLTMDVKSNMETMDVKRNTDLHPHPIIAGYRVAICNVHSPYTPFPTQHACSGYLREVGCIPTPKYRRKGLARWTFGAAMSHELIRQYSCISLHTGTYNDAHGMYRNFGFVDGLLTREFHQSVAARTRKSGRRTWLSVPTNLGMKSRWQAYSTHFMPTGWNADRDVLKGAERQETRLIYLAEKGW